MHRRTFIHHGERRGGAEGDVCQTHHMTTLIHKSFARETPNCCWLLNKALWKTEVLSCSPDKDQARPVTNTFSGGGGIKTKKQELVSEKTEEKVHS